MNARIIRYLEEIEEWGLSVANGNLESDGYELAIKLVKKGE